MAHIVGQTEEDGPASIQATTSALEALRDAIDAALANGTGMTTLADSQGRPFDLRVRRNDLERRHWPAPPSSDRR